TIVVKNMRDLVFLDPATGAIKQTLKLPARGDEKGDDKPGFSVVGLAVQGARIYATDADSQVRVAVRQEDGVYGWEKPLELGLPEVNGKAHGDGLAFAHNMELWVLSTRGNNVQRIDLATSKVVQTIPVGVAPFTLCFTGPDRSYVSNWGGDPPKENDPQALTSETPVRIDPKTGVANQGTVSVLARAQGEWKQIKTIEVGLHPSGMILGHARRLLYVANANSDSVSVVDTKMDKFVETIACRPEGRLPFGSGCNALALSPDGKTLYVANGTNNCVAVVRLGAPSLEKAEASEPAASHLLGLIPTGWDPGARPGSPAGKKQFVANIKGHGALSQPRPAAKGKNSHDHLGSISIIEVPDDKQLAKYTKEVNANNRLAYSLAGLDKARPDAKPV